MQVNKNFRNDLRLSYLNLLADYEIEDEFKNQFAQASEYIEEVTRKNRNKSNLSKVKAILSFANKQNRIKM